METLLIINIAMWFVAILVIAIGIKSSISKKAEAFSSLIWDKMLISEQVRKIALNILKNPHQWMISDSNCTAKNYVKGIGEIELWIANGVANRRYRVYDSKVDNELTMEERYLLEECVKLIKNRSAKVESLISNIDKD